jgi:hypothetical protein
MAVNVGQRNVPDTDSNKTLDACTKAMELAMHTLVITKNKNIFKEDFQKEIIDDINKTALDIYLTSRKANNIFVTVDNGNWRKRKTLQREVVDNCNRLIYLIDLSKRLFHLRGKKVYHWTKLAIETKALVIAWGKANYEKYEKKKD